MNDTALIVMSCDLYEDAWNPFFSLLSTYWKRLEIPVYLVTQEKNYNCPFFPVTVIKSGQNIPWTLRVRNAINKIGCKYFWLFLEDFFLMSAVNTEIIAEAEKIVKNDDAVGCINFIPDLDKGSVKKSECYEKSNYFKLCPLNNRVRITAVSSFWKADYFKRISRGKENPWEFETLGSIRSKFSRKKILWQDIEKYKPAFDYHYLVHFGYGITNRLWLPKNKELFEKHGIEANFAGLGIYVKPTNKRIKRSKKELALLIFKNPLELSKIIINKIKNIEPIIRFKNLIKAFI